LKKIEDDLKERPWIDFAPGQVSLKDFKINQSIGAGAKAEVF